MSDCFLLVGTRHLYNGTPHSFIALGEREASGEISITHELGKSLNTADFPCSTLCNQLFFYAEARVKEESFLKKKLIEDSIDEYEISYLAYQISKQQRDIFVKNLAYILNKKEVETTEPTLPISSKRLQIIKVNSYKLSIGNNCRHTALDLAELAQGRKISSDIAPRWFLSSLPFKTSIQRTQFTAPLVILPLPPTVIDVDIETIHAVSKLYKRIEKLSIPAQRNRVAKQKYEALVGFYCSQIENKTLNLDALIEGIMRWRATHSQLIDTHRGWHFCWQKTATHRCLDEVVSMGSKTYPVLN